MHDTGVRVRVKKFDGSMDTGGALSTLQEQKCVGVTFELSVTGRAASC